jgi:hypothetical protein
VDRDYWTRSQLWLSGDGSGCSILRGRSDNADMGEAMATKVPCSGNGELSRWLGVEASSTVHLAGSFNTHDEVSSVFGFVSKH